MACRPGAAPGPVGIGVRPAQAGARHIKKENATAGSRTRIV